MGAMKNNLPNYDHGHFSQVEETFHVHKLFIHK
jgi:hypothetical protein